MPFLLLAATTAYADINSAPGAAVLRMPAAEIWLVLPDAVFFADPGLDADQRPCIVPVRVPGPGDWSGLLVPTGLLSAEPLPPQSPADDQEHVTDLPAGPGSLTVALSSLLALGASRLARSIRYAQLAALPEWYHANAPDRLGHVTRLDLSTDRSLVPICWYGPAAPTVGLPPSFYYTRQLERGFCWRPSFFVPVISPRSPPTLA